MVTLYSNLLNKLYLRDLFFLKTDVFTIAALAKIDQLIFGNNGIHIYWQKTMGKALRKSDDERETYA